MLPQKHLWLACASKLVTYWQTCQHADRRLNGRELTALFASQNAYMSDSRALVEKKPKDHLWCHMTYEAQWKGNPKFMDCFVDESLNSLLKASARYVHQRNFESAVLTRMSYMLRVRHEKFLKGRRVRRGGFHR